MSEGLPRCAVVGAGRLGTAITTALAGAAGPYGRGFDGLDRSDEPFEVVLLCVPDAQIAAAARLIRPGPLVGHCSGATGLDVLGGRDGFALHPLMTVTGLREGELAGAGCAVAGTSAHPLGVADRLGRALGMTPVRVEDGDRALYHAAASFAANFPVTVAAAAERLMSGVGVPRELLVPLVRASVDNWAGYGAERALTGPVARGDEDTVRRQRAALAARAPDLVPLFDALTNATRVVADLAVDGSR